MYVRVDPLCMRNNSSFLLTRQPHTTMDHNPNWCVLPLDSKCLAVYNNNEKGQRLVEIEHLTGPLLNLGIVTTPVGFDDITSLQKAIWNFLRVESNDDTRLVLIFNCHGGENGDICGCTYTQWADWFLWAYNQRVARGSLIIFFGQCGSSNFARNFNERVKDSGLPILGLADHKNAHPKGSTISQVTRMKGVATIIHKNLTKTVKEEVAKCDLEAKDSVDDGIQMFEDGFDEDVPDPKQAERIPEKLIIVAGIVVLCFVWFMIFRKKK